MKQFLLFAGPRYYPGGGWQDFVDSFDTLEEAVVVGTPDEDDWGKWFHVIDATTGNEVA